MQLSYSFAAFPARTEGTARDLDSWVLLFYYRKKRKLMIWVEPAQEYS
jgi:hypothetical protein